MKVDVEFIKKIFNNERLAQLNRQEITIKELLHQCKMLEEGLDTRARVE